MDTPRSMSKVKKYVKSSKYSFEVLQDPKMDVFRKLGFPVDFLNHEFPDRLSLPNKLIEKFNYYINHEKDRILNYAKIYKDMFFCEPTEKKIIDSFEL